MQVNEVGTGIVGIRGIDDKLHRRLVDGSDGSPFDQTVIVIGKDHHGSRLPAAQHPVDALLVDIPLERKVGVGIHALDLLPHRLGTVGCHGKEGDVVHLGRDGKPEEKHLHHRHEQHDEHRAPVAQNMQGLFLDKM